MEEKKMENGKLFDCPQRCVVNFLSYLIENHVLPNYSDIKQSSSGFASKSTHKKENLFL